MAVFLRAYDRSGTFLGLMPDFTDLNVQTTDNAAGAMTFKYLMDGLNAAFLSRDELFLTTVEDGVESLDLFQLEEDTDDPAATLTQTRRRWITCAARGYMGVLDQAVVYPPGALPTGSNLYGLKPEYKVTQQTPGWIMQTFIQNAKGRGCFNELIIDFTATADSAGRAWPTKHDITYAVGTNYLQVLNSMIEDGWVDARTEGRKLRLFVPDTYFGVKSDVLRYGQNVLSAPRKRSRRDIFSHVLAAGDAAKKATVQVANATTASRFGRREGFASDGNRKTTASLAWMGNIELTKHQQFKEGFTLEMVMNPPGQGEFWPRPGIDFFCGDRIYYDRCLDTNGNYQQLLVRSITKAWGDTTKQATASIELADLFVKQTSRTAAQVSAITNGSTGVRQPPPKAPERDTFPPVQPTQCTVTGQTDLFPEGTRKVYRSKATITWPFVDQDSDGTPLEDLDGYEVQTSINGGPWSASKVTKDTQELIDGLKPLDLVRARVLARDLSGNRSDWTTSTSVQMPMDTTAPLVPTAPVLTQKLGNVTARWDGLGMPGPAAMPDDFDHVVLERCLTNAFTAGVITVDRLYLPDATAIITGLPYNQTWYFRFVAVDVQGNRSMPSAQSSIATVPLVNADLPAKVISDIDKAISDANAAGSAAAAAQSTANAAATQTAFDSALTRLTTTEGVASAAKSTADLAAPQTAVDGILNDLSANYYTKTGTESYVQTSVATKAQIIYATTDATGTSYNNGDIWRKVDTLANGGKILAEWTFVKPGAGWVTRVYTGSVLTALDAGTITAGFLDAARINAGALSIGQVNGLGTSLTNAQTAADGVDATNLNPSFSQWPTATAAPTNWTYYVTNAARESALARTQPYAVRFTCPDTTTAYGIFTTQASGLAPLPYGTEYVTLTIDLMLNSGTSLNGSGVLFDWVTTGYTSNDFRAFWKFADDIPAPVAGKWYRLTRVLRRPTKVAGGPQTAWQLYVMANYGSGLNAMTVKDLIVNRVAARPSSTSEIAAYSSATSSSVTALSLRGADLVTNGIGQTKDNTNFSAWTWNSDAPAGAVGSFMPPLAFQRTDTHDELIAVDSTKKYRVSGWIKNLGTAPSTFYFRVWFCDISGAPMDRGFNCIRAGSEATLAAPLNPGDTTMKIAGGIASWQASVAANEAYYARYISFYDYVDANGRAWPAYTFTKSQIRNSGTNPAFSAVAADGTVTLAVPYAGTAKPAGLEVAIGVGGDTSTYSWVTNGAVPSDWTNYVGTLAGVQNGIAPTGGQFPYGTAFIKLAFLHHYMAGTDVPNHKPVVTFSVSEAAAAQATADAVDALTTGWKFTGKTTINGGVIETDTIRAAQIAAGSIGAKQLLVADTANMAEVNEATAGAVSYAGWTHALETVGGVRWSRRDITTNTYFMFRNQVGPLPFKTGDRVRMTFEAFADANVAATPSLWTYGGSANTGVGFSVAPTPEGGTAWPTTITTTPQAFAFEAVMPAVTDQTAYLMGLYGVSARDVRVRNVRIYRMGAGELIVDGTITAKQIKANTITTNELATNVLTIGNIGGLQTRTDLVDGWRITGKTTINGGQIEADTVTAAAVKANVIGAKHLAIGDMSNMAELNEQVAGNIDVDTGSTNALETVAGVPWSKRTVITGQYFFFRNRVGPLPFKAGDRIRLTFEAFADANVTPTPYVWTYGTTTAYAAFAAAPTPAGGTAWPTLITTAAQQFAYEVVVPALTDQNLYLIGLAGLTGRNVRVRNVRAYRMGAGELVVDGSIEGRALKVGTVDADRIIASTLTIGKVQGLQTKVNLYDGWSLNGKTTINGGAIEADTLSVAAIKAGSIGVAKLAVADTANMATIDAEPAGASFDGMAYAKVTGVDGATNWIGRTGTTKSTYFMFRPNVGPVPLKAGDRVRLTFEGYVASGAITVTANTYLYGGSGDIYPGFAPVAGSPTQLTTVPQTFTLEAVMPAGVKDQIKFLLGISSGTFATVEPFVRNVRAYRMGAGELLVDGSIEAKHMKANSITADAIAVGSISVDKIQQGVLRTNLIGDPSFEETYAFTSMTDPGQGSTWQWRKVTSGTGAVMQRVTGKARSGARRLTLGTDATGGVGTQSIAYSPTFTVQAGKTYRVNWYSVATGAGATGANTAKLSVEAVFGPSVGALDTATPLAVSEGVVSVGYAAVGDITPDLFLPDSGDLVIPAGQTNLFGAIRIIAANNAADCAIYVDDVSVVEVGIGGASELTAAGLRLFDDSGDEATALVTNRPNYYTVTKDGVTLAAIGGDGNADFRRAGVVEDIDVAGAPLLSGWKDAFGNRTFGTSWESALPMQRDFTAKPVGIVESLSGGIVAHQANVPSNSGLLAAGAYQMISRVAADLEMGRFYTVRTSPLLAIIPSGATVALILRWTTDGTDPTPTSQILARDYKTGNGSYETFQIADRPIAGSANQRDIRIMAQLSYLAGSGTVTPIQDLFLLSVYDEGYQPDASTGTAIQTTVQASGSGTQPATKKTYVSTWKANNSQTRRGTSSYGTNTINTSAGSGKVLAGYYSSSNGIQHAYLEFSDAGSSGSETGRTISQALTGATVKKVEVYVKNASFYSSSGGKMKFSMTTLGGVSGASTLAPPSTAFTADQTFTVGQGKWVTLPNESLTSIKNGGRVVCLYPGNTTSRTYYSGWVNHTLTNGKPLLRVTYER